MELVRICNADAREWRLHRLKYFKKNSCCTILHLMHVSRCLENKKPDYCRASICLAESEGFEPPDL